MTGDHTNNKGYKHYLGLLNKLFTHAKLRRSLEKIRIPLGGALVIVLFIYGHQEMFIPAVVISLLGELIQIWSSGSLEKNVVLTLRGPYCLVRNPMYLGRFFVILGALLLLKNFYIIIIYVGAFFYYVANRVKREEKHLIEIFGEPYVEYCNRVNRFLPRLGGCETKDTLFFRFRLLVRNNEHLNFLALLAFYLAFYVISAITQ
jgi:protein-S-isoprenylcysteine O-methyltransferase Ste14